MASSAVDTQVIAATPTDEPETVMLDLVHPLRA
jgi:hypothetical protein